MNYYEPANVRGAGEFVALAQLMLRAKGRAVDAVLLAGESRAPERVQRILQKASAGSTSAEGWQSLVDYRLVASGFLESLRSLGAFDRMLAEAIRRVPLRTRVAAFTTASTGSLVAEGAVKPISQLELTAGNIEPIRVVTIVCATDELVRFAGSAGAATLSREMRRGTVAATDAAFLTSLASGAASIESSGTDVDGVTEDIRSLCMGIDVSAESMLYIVMHPFRAKLVALMVGPSGPAFPDLTYRGGSIAGIPVVVSDQIDDDEVLLIDAAQIAGDSDAVTLDVAQQATLDLAGGGSPTFSTWQRNSVALRSERWFGWQVIGSNAVAQLTSVSWAEAATP